jgi:nucleotide-binding universal stress UspA family protein
MSESTHSRPRIVVGYDGSASARAALELAVERARSGGTLFLVHAWDPPEHWRGSGHYQPVIDDALAEAKALLAEARAEHPELGLIDCVTELIAGPPARAIADVAAVRDADEIVVGTRGFSRARALLGSVSHELIHLAACPVTVIPEAMVAGDAGRRPIHVLSTASGSS